MFDRGLRARVVFGEHDLATDEMFSEVQRISCRNVLICFDERLQNRVLRPFAESLDRGGFFGLGSHETLAFSDQAALFSCFNEQQRIWRRNALQESSAHA